MRAGLIGGLLWGLFAVLLTAASYLTLSACELGIRPLFGFTFCEESIEPERAILDLERTREQDLRNRLHQSELKLARLPECLPPRAETPPEEDIKKAEIAPEPEPAELPEEELSVPDEIDELEGCWQSVRGDLSIVSDDAEERPIGNVRKCYCFRKNGRGEVRLIYTDGVKCRGGINAELLSGSLRIHQPKLSCQAPNGEDRGIVRQELTCRGTGSDASCDTANLGRIRDVVRDEKYHRVTNEHCEWQG